MDGVSSRSPPCAVFALPGSPVDIGPGLVAGAAGWGVAQRESLITAGGLASNGKISIMFGATERPLVVECPNQGHREPADLLDGESAITQPVQVNYIGIASAVVILQLLAKPRARPGNRVESWVLGVETAASLVGETRLKATP